MSSTGRLASIAEVFDAFGRAMRERGARWYVYGGQAVLAYGRPRMTADVDITVDLGSSSPSELLVTLEKYGFETTFPLSAELLAQLKLLRMVHVPTKVPLDVVIATGGIEQMVLARTRTVELSGVEVPLISVEDLIALKVLAGRRKDLDDVRGVLAAQAGRVDLERTRAMLAIFEQSLEGREGLQAKLDRLLGAKPAARKRPPRKPRA